MQLIVGLGNPGNKYKKNRHNLGFMIADSYLTTEGLTWSYSPDWVCYWCKNAKTVFIKPTTFMNESGLAVVAVAEFYKIHSKNILIVYDDLDLPFGKVRLAFDGVSAGHHGIDSIVESLGGIDFGRLRVGVGRPINPRQETASFLLEDFSDSEVLKLPKIMEKSIDAVNSYLADGIEATMNKFN